MIDSKEIAYFHIAKTHCKQNPTFVDVGAFQGNWTDHILAQTVDLDNISIFLFEPNIDKYSILVQKYAKYSNIKIFNCLISNTDKVIDYYQLQHQDQSIVGMSGCVFRSIYKNYKYEIRKIQSIKLDTIFENQTIDYLKIDTEGLELDVIQGCHNLLSNQRIQFIQFEYGGTYQDNNISLNDIIKLLHEHKYCVYNLEQNSLYIIEQYKDDFKYNNFLATHININ